MSLNLEAERLFGEVNLGTGSGIRQKGDLCIMSLVAHLAGERHSDHPRCVSPFLRKFAIQLNDGSPDSLRQDLKPFAPRIIGTNDGHDFERATLTYRVIIEEVLPRAKRDGIILQENRVQWRFNPLRNFAASLMTFGLRPWTTYCVDTLCRAHERADYLRAGALAGQLFTGLVWRAPAHQRWYWAKALELLDRLCESGADRHFQLGLNGQKERAPDGINCPSLLLRS